MAKTYNTLTDLTTGDVLTETWVDEAKENFDNLIVPPMVQVISGTAWSIPTSTAVTLGYTQEHFDTDSMWSSGGSITINTPGVYLARANVQWEANASGARTLTMYAGTVPIASTTVDVDSATNHSQHLAATYEFAAADTLSIQVSQTSGTALNVNVQAQWSPVLGAAWLGRASAP